MAEEKQVYAGRLVSECILELLQIDLAKLYAGLNELIAGRMGMGSLALKQAAQDAIISSIAAGSGVIISADDQTVGGLEGKAVPGYGLKMVVLDPGAAESLQFALGDTYDTIWIGAGGMTPCITNGAAPKATEYTVNKINLDVLTFDSGATEERAQVTFTMPERWDRGPVKVRAFWSNAPGASPGNTVEWGFKAAAITDGEALDKTLGTPVYISTPLLIDGGLEISAPSSELTVGGTVHLGDMIQWEIFRNTSGADTMLQDAYLIGFEIQCKLTGEVADW
ncbi:MAG: hypothetical protein JEZ12_21605 [Desulfobacterium sp.]|nr:hypothetical protein [Desulfobacterium sp.]